MRQRLDVDAARSEVTLMSRAATLARNFRLFGRVEVGIQGHRDPDGPRVLGPTLTLDLPIFDQRQAEIARLDAARRQAERRLAEISVDARSEVRAARMQMLTARKIIDRYRTRLLPLREQIVALSQLQYNGMLLGPAQLLAAKQSQVDTYQQYVEALRDYWSGRAELERALGGRLGASTAQAAQNTPLQPSEHKDHAHEHPKQ
jgi:cobalt-zinc-cadmium efflux system outer membrane protein